MYRSLKTTLLTHDLRALVGLKSSRRLVNNPAVWSCQNDSMVPAYDSRRQKQQRLLQCERIACAVFFCLLVYATTAKNKKYSCVYQNTTKTTCSASSMWPVWTEFGNLIHFRQITSQTAPPGMICFKTSRPSFGDPTVEKMIILYKMYPIYCHPLSQIWHVSIFNRT